jgi:protein TonB
LASLVVHASALGVASWVYGEPQAVRANERVDAPFAVAMVERADVAELAPIARPEFQPLELAFDEEPIAAPAFDLEVPELPEPQPLEEPALANEMLDLAASAAVHADIRSLASFLPAQGRPTAGVGSGGGGDASAPVGGTPGGRGTSEAGAPSDASASASATAVGALGTSEGTGTAARVPLQTPPRVLDHPDPTYPRLSRRRNEEGDVELRLHVDIDGKVTSVDVVLSSGFARLDEAAVEGVKLWKFAPATLDGRPVASTCPQRVRFQLVDAD